MNKNLRTSDEGTSYCAQCEIYAREIDALKIKCVNEHANAKRVLEWINDPHRKRAVLSFTEGPERQVAYAAENRVACLEKVLEATKKYKLERTTVTWNRLLRTIAACDAGGKV